MMKIKICERCGKAFNANSGHQIRCQECIIRHQKEYHARYYLQNKANFTHIAVESETKRKAKNPENAGLTLAQVQLRARELGLTYGRYMLLVQTDGLEDYIKNRRIENENTQGIT